MKLLNFNTVYLFIHICIGIIIQHHFAIPLKTVLVGCGVSFLLLTIQTFRDFKIGTLNKFYSPTLALVCICLGGLLLALKSYENQPGHYSKLPDISTHTLVLKIEKRLKPGFYHNKYYAQLLQADGHDLSGRVLVNIERHKTAQLLKADYTLVAKTELKPIDTPLNPHQFNYSQYLKKHGITQQMYLDSLNHKVVKSQPTSVYGYADVLRAKINQSLKNSGFSSITIQMINALLLGQKQDIDSDIYNNYIKAGTVHILAVSGLHVGIFLWILTWLFKPLLYLKYGHYLRVSLIVILLWSFAFIAGLSPSVTRAVTMFSLVSIALHLKRETNIYNTLVVSALLLLLINPYILFEVGFQLSYAAVLSIVVFQPLICNIWQPKTKVLNYLWQIFGVTIAAQLGVAPLSLFYFHQFPGLFFLSNLVVVPVLGLILGFGLFVIVLSLLDSIPQFLIHSFEKVIRTLNEFITWIAQFESFLFRDIRFDLLQVIITYALLAAIYWALTTKRLSWIALCLSSIIGFQAQQLYRTLKPNNYPFIVFNKNRHSIIGEQQQHKLTLHHSLADTLILKQQFLKNYKVGEGLTSMISQGQKRVYAFEQELLLVVDSTAVYKDISFKPTIVLLQHSPKLNLDRLLQTLNPKLVIADASNYKSYVVRWKNTCELKNTRFYYTAKAGAFLWPN